MKKYKVTTAANAVKKGLVKVGDTISIDCTVINLKPLTAHINGTNVFISENRKIRIPIPEPKPIDFGEAGRVLNGEYVVMTTGVFHKESKCFSGYLLESIDNLPKGYTSNNWPADIIDWQDITDTYKP